MRPVNWNELVQICKEEGFVYDRQKGSHYIMAKPGANRPVVIPKRRQLKEGIVLSVAKTIGLTSKEIRLRLKLT